MGEKSRVPAAQYMRMSTEDQHYSLATQEAAIRRYAELHGLVVVSTYVDAGKSGVEIKHRKELRRLIHDVTSGNAQYKAILVYDVSRWGRFQDVDEAAHYEFLCKSVGVPVRYCAEQFENDGSLPSSMMKALKRTMAAEYSRELGIKVSAGMRRLALLGFRVAGGPGFGLRRMIVSPDVSRRIILKSGERKAVKTDRTILVPGPKREVDCVRAMFGLAASGNKRNLEKIAKELNNRHMCLWYGKAWDGSSVRRVLTNEKYAGCNTFGKTTRSLGARTTKIEPKLWVKNPNAFVPIVTMDVFNRAQALVYRLARRQDKPNTYWVRMMRRVLLRQGKLTQKLLQQKHVFDYKTCYKRFGTLAKAYELAGFQIPARTASFMESRRRVDLLREVLDIRLKELFGNKIKLIRLPRQRRTIVEIDGGYRVAIYLCRATRSTYAGERGWMLRLRSQEKDLSALVCTMDQSFSKLLKFYLFPPFGPTFLKARVLRESQPWFSHGRKLTTLADFCTVANEVVPQFHNRKRHAAVDDILISSDSCTIALRKRDIVLGPVTSAIFNQLALNAGKAVTHDQLRQCVPGKPLNPACLGPHIRSLRLKLGAQARERIQRVFGVGYMYVSPSRKPEKKRTCN